MARLSQLSRSVTDRVVIITGAGSGMGRATAHLFADEGARVAVCDWNRGGVEDVAREIIRSGGAATGHVVDVSDPAGVDSMVAAVQDKMGAVDILVNNAGLVRGGPVDGPGFVDDWEATLAVDLTAHVHLIRACLPDLRRRGEGRVVNISSTEGLGGTAFNAAYTAAKHGVIGLTRALAVELGPTGVTVNAICPGPIETAMTEPIPDDAKATFARRRTAVRRYGTPEEVAHLTLALCLPSASYVTGVALPVDGGMLARNQ